MSKVVARLLRVIGQSHDTTSIENDIPIDPASIFAFTAAIKSEFVQSSNLWENLFRPVKEVSEEVTVAYCYLNKKIVRKILVLLMEHHYPLLTLFSLF